jgi:uncharacterized delta-60 repeat protein
MNRKLILHKFRSMSRGSAWITAALWLVPAIVSIAQTPPPSAGTLQFTDTEYKCGERESLAAGRSLAGARITVTRSQPAQGRVLVDYEFKNGTATNGTHFNGTNGILAFADFQMSADIIVPVIDDATNNPNRTFTIMLKNARADAGEPASVAPQLGIRTNATVTIYDDDLGFTFSRIYTRVAESQVAAGSETATAGSATLTVYLPDAHNNDVRVDYRVLTGDPGHTFKLQAGSDYATPDDDFTVASGTLTFSRSTSQQNITIPILNDGLVEFNEDFQVELSNPSGKVLMDTNEVDAAIGQISLATVTILFDDSLGVRHGTNNINGVITNFVTTFAAEQPAGAVDRTYNPQSVAWSRPPFNSTPGANYSVYALAVQRDGQTVIGGDFTGVNTDPLTRIARLDTNGWTDTSFSVGTGVDGPVETVAVYAAGPQGGKIVIGGSFTSVNGVQRQGIARLETNGTVDVTFNPGIGADGSIRSLAVLDDGKVVVGGDFTSINGVTRNGIARLHANGSVDLSFDPGLGADGPVWAVGLDSASAAIQLEAGQSGVGPTEFRTNIDTRASSGRITVNFGPACVPDTLHIYYNGVRIFDSGLVNEYNGDTNCDFANYTGPLAYVVPYGPGPSTEVTFVINEGSGDPGTVWDFSASIENEVAGNHILVGGEFTSMNGVPRSGVARLNTDGTLDATFDPGSGADGPVYAITVQNDLKVLIAGAFGSVDLKARPSIARLNQNGSVDLGFYAGVGADNAIYALTMQNDGRILIGGPFRQFNHVRRIGIARLLDYGALDTTFGDTAYNQFAGVVDPNSFVSAIGVQPDGRVMIGGTFTRVGGGTNRVDRTVRFNVARLIGGSTPGPGNVEFVTPDYRVDENGGQLQALLMRTNGMLGAVSVTAVAHEGLAIAGSDYTDTLSAGLWATLWPGGAPGEPGWMVSDGGTNSLTFAPTITIPILDDSDIEGNETFFLDLSVPQSQLLLGGEDIPLGVAAGRDHATVTIVDNDFNPGSFSFSAPSFTVNENGTNAVITVIRTGGSVGSVQVDYMTANGTNSPALAGSDYTARNSTLSFASGQTNRTFTVPIINDTTVEPDETFFVKLTNARGGATLGEITNAVVTIIDNDYAPGRLAFAAPTFSVNEFAGLATVAVRRSGGNVGAISVEAVAFDGTASSPADYAATNVVLNWADGDTADKLFRVAISNDGLVEANETIMLRLTNYVAALPASQSNAVLTIVDDDFYGSLGFNSATYSADEIGGSVIITVVRSGGIAGTVSVGFAATNLTGAGWAGTNDYVRTNGTLTFLAGQLSATFTVRILDDALTEGDESVRLVLSAPTGGATLGAVSTATLHIVDDESVNNPAGSLDSSFNSSAGANGTITAVALQPNGAILVAGDFSAVNSVTRGRIARVLGDGGLDASFNPGLGLNDSARALALQSDGRVIVGGLFTAVNATNRNHIARLNIDGSVDVSFNPGAGADNPVNALVLTSVAGARKVLVGGSFSSFNGVPRNAVTRLNDNGSVDMSFDPGTGANGPVYAIAVQADGKVLVGGDFTIFNGVPQGSIARLNTDGTLDESFNAGAGADSSVRAVALQADGKIVLGGLFTSFAEVARGRLARLNFDGSLDTSFGLGAGADGAVLAIAVQVDGKLVLGGEFTSFDGINRHRINRLNPDGAVDPTINFGEGANNFISALALQPDRKIIIAGGFTAFDDQPRNYLARLHGGSLAGSGSLEFAAPTFTASENGTNGLVIVRRMGGTIGTVSVNYAVVGGTATNGSDYTLADGTLTFPEGETRQTITVPLINDTTIENDETVLLQLSAATGGAILGDQPTAVLIIVSDDSVVRFATPSFSVTENTVSGNSIISVTRTGAVSGTVSVNYSTAAGTATPGLDYNNVSGTLVFAPGESVKTFVVPILDDTLVEPNETVTLRLSNVTGPAILGTPSTAVLTINENDFSPGVVNFSVPAVSVAESNTSVALTVTRTNGSSGTISVRYSTANGTATAATDYGLVNATLVFGDGQTERTISIPLFPDFVVEGNETFEVVLSDPTGGATIGGQNRVTVTIQDDDFGPGSLDPGFDPGTGANAPVRSVAVQPDGRIIIGGAFTQFNGVDRNYVARLNSAGPLDFGFNIGTGANGLVSAVALDSADGDVLLAGSFTSVNGSPRNRVARLTSTGATDLAQDQPSGLDAAAYALAVQADSKTIIGGSFSIPKPCLARLRVNGSPDTSFDTGAGANGPIFAVAMQADGGAVAGGSFTSIDGASRSRVARFFGDGALDLTFVPPTVSGGSVFAVAIQPDLKVIIGGDFTSVGGQSRNRIARLNADGSLDTSFNPGSAANGTVWCLGLDNGNGNSVDAIRILAGGEFTQFAGARRNRIVRLSATGALDPTFDPGLGANNTVYSLAPLANGKIIIGGEFTAVNGFPRNGVARLNGDTGGETLRIRSGFGFSANTFHLSVDAVAGRRYSLDLSTDLINWTPVMTNTAVGAVLDFIDNTPAPDRRFYRARQVP